ncbi:hypothetical protein [Streptomyces sp. NBC_00091]|uniref:hypothetical protein n=1 Tax=Streptomyces sp. NBC_00091 TaxID=2975648 RepID=UPI00225A9F4E|nr:hypothetical protein [Streptomyces sp. NBC_00091]MCX5380098.1 hypothetical protein [Streptomyces sp. NBC_00091]
MTRNHTAPTVPAAPRWAVRAAHITALLTLPTGVWRLFLAAGFLAGYTEAGYAAAGIPGWGRVYVVLLSVASELLALLTLGLVRPWGEVLPRWIPLVGGRRPAPGRVVAAAGVGAAVLTLVWTPFAFWWLVPHPDMTASGAALVGFLYLPLAAWGPLLGALTLSYRRRHRAGTA